MTSAGFAGKRLCRRAFVIRMTESFSRYTFPNARALRRNGDGDGFARSSSSPSRGQTVRVHRSGPDFMATPPRATRTNVRPDDLSIVTAVRGKTGSSFVGRDVTACPAYGCH